MSESPKYRWVCGKCGSEDIICSGPLTFDYEKQEWVTDGSTYEDDFCNDCEEECNVEQVLDETV